MAGKVAPFAGAWIEIFKSVSNHRSRRSLPSRERGLKCQSIKYGCLGCRVAPFAGAWIEIRISGCGLRKWSVAPFAGAWIEI